MDDQFNDNYEERATLGQGDQSMGTCKEHLDEESARRQGNQHQPEAECSYSLESGTATSTLDGCEPLSCTSRKPHKSKSCPIKQHFKLCEKRTLSSSSENLLNDDLPRKSFKLCRGFIKRWFHGSDKSGRDALKSMCRRTCSFQEEQTGFENGAQQDSTSRDGDRGSARTDSTTSSLASSCSVLPSTITSTCYESNSESENQLPCFSSEAAALNDSQGPRTQAHEDAHGRDTDGSPDEEVVSEALHVQHLHLSLLPPHVVAHIFSYLTVRELLCAAALVCRRWRHLSQIPSLWLQINLRNYTSVSDEDLINLCSRHSNVRLLDLSDCLKITDDGFKRSLVHCKMLSEVFLIRCSQLGVTGFQSLAAHCWNLTHLDVTGCTGLTDAALESIAERCPLLQKLRLKQCPLISDTSLQVVARSCPRLKLLTFMDNDKITDVTLEALGGHSHNLEILCLQNCSIAPPGLVQITKLSLLRKLDLSNLSRLTGEAVRQVASHCRLMDTLNLSLSSGVGDECVAHVAASCLKLTNLFLISCDITDKALFSIGDKSTCLEHLDVSWCVNITDHGATYVSEHCLSLNYLGLIRCSKISDTVVARMVTDHPGIHYSTFLLDSKRLMDKAKEQGFIVSD